MSVPVRKLRLGGATPSAVDAFKAQYQLMPLKRAAEKIWKAVDVVLMPTAPIIFDIARPTDFRFGVTFVAPPALLRFADRMHRCYAGRLGATPWTMPPWSTAKRS